jgi:hypothetical protein
LRLTAISAALATTTGPSSKISLSGSARDNSGEFCY